MNRSKIIVVDDHDIIRQAVKCLVDMTDHLSIVAETGEGGEVIALCREYIPDVLLLDISLNNRDGLDVLMRVKKEFNHLPVLMFTGHEESKYGVRSIQSGAAGYLNKRNSATQLVTAIDCVLSGHKYITPSMAQLLANWVLVGKEESAYEILSDREFQTLQLISTGLSVSEIAEKLHLSVKTISMYRGRVLEKLGLRHNGDLMRYAMDNSLVDSLK
ncbi:MAG: hypothetical protein RI893_903 [Pseudomonadota bacterium]|jgi:DNA-binding NarL/FixJ family response regulator